MADAGRTLASRRSRLPAGPVVRALAVTLSMASPALAGEAAPLIGIGLHNAQSVRPDYQPAIDLPLLRDLGFDTWRDDVYERKDETGPVYPLATLPRLNAMLESGFGTPLLVLLERQPRDGLPPVRDRESRARFAAFARSVVRAVAARPVIYEIGNEWNMRWRRSTSIGPLSFTRTNHDYSPESYALWARETTRAIRAEAPDAQIVVGAIGEDKGWVWTRRALAAGMAEGASGVSVHLYNHCAPMPERTAEDLLSRLDDFHRLVTDTTGRQDLRIYVTEYGWPSPKAACTVPPDRAAANVAQFILATRARSWVAGIWFYEFRDRGHDPSELEDNFGLLDRQGHPKPAACALKAAATLARDLSAADLTAPTPTTRWLKGRDRKGRPLWVLWSTADAGTPARLAPPPGSEVHLLCSPARDDARPSTIGMMPVVVRPPAEAADWAEPVVAPP